MPASNPIKRARWTCVHESICSAVLGANLLGGCSGNETPAEQVRTLCGGIRVGEPFVDVEARYSEFRLQTGGFAPDPGVRLGESHPAQERQKIPGILVEPWIQLGVCFRPNKRHRRRLACTSAIGRLLPPIMMVDLPVQIAEVNWNTQLRDLLETIPSGHDLPAFRAATGRQVRLRWPASNGPTR